MEQKPKQTTENFIKETRRKTRRLFSSEQKLVIVMEAQRVEFHVDTAEAYVVYGHILLGLNNKDLSKTYLQKAYNIRQAKLGDTHPDTVKVKTFLNNY